MQNTSILIQALCFSVGFFWVCHQAQIEFSTVVRSLLTGFLVGFAGLWTYVFMSHANLLQSLIYMPVAGLLGAGLMLWIQENDKLSGRSSRDSAFLLTLSFIYFCSPLKDSLRVIAILGALPAIGILLFCMSKSKFDLKEINIITSWTVIVSMVMGIQSLGSSPEVLEPMKKTALIMANAPYFFSIAMQAAGFVSLALGIVPLIDWVQRSYFEKAAAEDKSNDDKFSIKRALILTVLHGLPMILNMKYKICSHDAMMAYSLAWSPIVSTHFANAMEPEPPAKIPGWDQDATQAS